MNSMYRNFVAGIGAVAIGAGVLYTVIKRRSLIAVNPKNVVFITGCDSGLGYNLSLFCHSLNMTVVSGCLDVESEGAKLLRNSCDPQRLRTIQINLKDQKTITKASDFVKDVLAENDQNKFTALVNNAGVMCFGEFEWQTNSIFENQIEVNLIGTMRITKEFLPLLRKDQGRIVNITSHCGLEALPGFAPYAASKAGLRFWNDSLRLEMKKYGVSVVNFLPGSFVRISNITAQQKAFADEMRDSFTKEQKDFYGEYFEEYNSYLNLFCGPRAPTNLDDEKFFWKFKRALLAKYPSAIYIHEPLRYKIYNWLFLISPTPVKDWLMDRYVSMPTYKPKSQKLMESEIENLK